VIGGAQQAAPTVVEPDPEIGRLKAALAATVPGLDASQIEGDSLESVTENFAALRELAVVPKPAPPPTVPAGAPGRRQLQPATPFEKIREGLARLSG
jgi:hypothetical protein